MAQTLGRLSAIKVAKLKEPGYDADGGNLYFREARAAGCDDYVPKPYSPRQLPAKIRQYIPQ